MKEGAERQTADGGAFDAVTGFRMCRIGESRTQFAVQTLAQTVSVHKIGGKMQIMRRRIGEKSGNTLGKFTRKHALTQFLNRANDDLGVKGQSSAGGVDLILQYGKQAVLLGAFVYVAVKQDHVRSSFPRLAARISPAPAAQVLMSFNPTRPTISSQGEVSPQGQVSPSCRMPRSSVMML